MRHPAASATTACGRRRERACGVVQLRVFSIVTRFCGFRGRSKILDEGSPRRLPEKVGLPEHIGFWKLVQFQNRRRGSQTPGKVGGGRRRKLACRPGHTL